MTTPRAYFDHNATTPVLPAVRDAMNDALDHVGNPSSIHAEGRAARGLIDTARRAVAALAGSFVDDVIFTSGATEALNMVLTPELTGADGPFDRLLIGAGEHPAVVAGHRFAESAVETIATTADGRIDLRDLAAALDRNAGHRVMLALQAANNETGVIQPVAEAAALIHARGGFVVCDAVQAVGKIDCRLACFDADAMAISAHKFGGPKGVGALIFAATNHHLSRGVVRGGGQERGLRSGTENLSGIAGLGAAALLADQRRAERHDQMLAWRHAIEAIVVAHVPEAIIFGAQAPRLSNTVSFAAPRMDAQVLLMNLDLCGIAVSAGSACASGKVKPSAVLDAMGVTAALAASTLRISLGWTTRDDDIVAFDAAMAAVMGRMRAKASRRAAQAA